MPQGDLLVIAIQEVYAVDTGSTDMLFDSGRIPLLFRVPALLLAFVCLAIETDLVSLLATGEPLLMPPPIRLPLGWLSAFIGTTLLAAFLSQIWVGRKRILWKAAHRQLLVEDRWLLGTSRMRIGQSDIAAVCVQFGEILASKFWNILIRGPSGKVT